MSKLQIFLSSHQKEFASERKALKDYIEGDALLRRFFDIFVFENLPAIDKNSKELYLDEVNNCDIYIGLFGDIYGLEDDEGYSPLIFIKNAEDSLKDFKMKSLIATAQSELVRKRFQNISELIASIYASLIMYLEDIGKLGNVPFDRSVVKNSSLDEIDDEKLDTFLERAKSSRNFAILSGTPKQKVLMQMNLLDDGKPTNAALLLFGKFPQRFFISSEVKCLHFHGTEVAKPIPSYQIYKGTLFELADQAIDFVLSKLSRSVGTRENSNEVSIKYEIPQLVISEAVINAIAHRDYTSNSSVQVMLFSDRLEIWNPGHLPPNLTLDDLLHDHSSIPANPLMAEPLFLAKYIEKVGSGTVDMIRLCKEAGLGSPSFRIQGGNFVFTITRDTLEVPVEVPVKLTGTEKRILDGLLTKTLHTKDILAILGYKTKTGNFRKSIARLLSLKLIEMTKPQIPNAKDQAYRIMKKD